MCAPSHYVAPSINISQCINVPAVRHMGCFHSFYTTFPTDVHIRPSTQTTLQAIKAWPAHLGVTSPLPFSLSIIHNSGHFRVPPSALAAPSQVLVPTPSAPNIKTSGLFRTSSYINLPPHTHHLSQSQALQNDNSKICNSSLRPYFWAPYVNLQPSAWFPLGICMNFKLKYSKWKFWSLPHGLLFPFLP